MQQQFDILIIGGGMVGCSLACGLAQLNLRVAIIEASPWNNEEQPSFDDRSIALSYTSKKILQGLNIWEALQEKVTAIKKIHISEKNSYPHQWLSAKQEKVPALGYVVENRHFGSTLQAMIARYENITLFTPAKLFRLQQYPHQVTITITQLEQEYTLTGELLVASDGAVSRTVDILGLQRQIRSYGQYALITNVITEYPHNNIAYERFTDNGSVAFLPLRDNRCAVVWSIQEHQLAEIMALDDHAFLTTLQSQFSWRLGELKQLGKRQRYPLQCMSLNQLYQHRCVVMGNAAHTLHPIAGQGFNLGLRDVALFLETIKDEDNNININKLHKYEQQRLQDIQITLQWSDQLIRLFTHHNPLFKTLRTGGLLAMEIFPPIKHFIARHGMGYNGKISRLASGLAP